MHKEVKKFCESIKRRFPEHFTGKNVLDCGSLDINGNNRYLFENCNYTGIDICEGKNVDVVTSVHQFRPAKPFDVVISTEMLEHDDIWDISLTIMLMYLRSGGLLLFTAAGTGRPEHGTHEHHPKDSPKTQDYYRNITAKMIIDVLNPEEAFSWFEISYKNTDIRFAGVKR